VLVHGAARVLEPQQNLIVGLRHAQHRGYFLAQGRGGVGSKVSFEIEHEGARPRLALLGPGALITLALFLPRLGLLLEAPLAVDDALELVGRFLETAVQVLDDEALGTTAPATGGDQRDDDDD
jgi:hypothetical protein